jgi:hypothetical protein
MAQIPPGTVVMKEGEPGNYFCFVVEGELRMPRKATCSTSSAPATVLAKWPCSPRPRRPHGLG